MAPPADVLAGALASELPRAPPGRLGERIQGSPHPVSPLTTWPVRPGSAVRAQGPESHSSPLLATSLGEWIDKTPTTQRARSCPQARVAKASRRDALTSLASGAGVRRAVQGRNPPRPTGLHGPRVPRQQLDLPTVILARRDHSCRFFSHQLVWRTEHGWLVAMGSTGSLDSRAILCIRDVCRIPGQ
jgi:hypothetical protein